MSQSINLVIIAGRLGQDPKGGDAGRQRFCRFSVATTRSWKGKDDEWQEKTEWHNVVVWGRDAEKCEENLQKGSSVTVHGRIESREYDSGDEKKRITEIIAERVVFAAKSSGGSERSRDRDDDRGSGSRSRGRDDDRRDDRRDDDRRGGRSSSSRRDDDRGDRKRDDDRGRKPKSREEDEPFDEAVPF